MHGTNGVGMGGHSMCRLGTDMGGLDTNGHKYGRAGYERTRHELAGQAEHRRAGHRPDTGLGTNGLSMDGMCSNVTGTH